MILKVCALECSNKPWREGGPTPHFSDPQLTGLTQNESLFLLIILDLLIERQEMVFHRKQGAKPQPGLVLSHVHRPSLGFSITPCSKPAPAPAGWSSGPQLVGPQNPGRVWVGNLKDPSLAPPAMGREPPIFLSSDLLQITLMPSLYFFCFVFLLPWSQKTFCKELKPSSRDRMSSKSKNCSGLLESFCLPEFHGLERKWNKAAPWGWVMWWMCLALCRLGLTQLHTGTSSVF